MRQEEIPMEQLEKTGVVPAPVSAEARELAFVLARNDANFTHAILTRALVLEKVIYGRKKARV